MKRLKQEKAITLIALVITIIVLLILAGVSIATLTRRKWNINTSNKGTSRKCTCTSKRSNEIRICKLYVRKKSEGNN